MSRHRAFYDFAWLDRALDVFEAHGLRVILGTPTATPPKWLVDRDPDMVALDSSGRPRRFGSRRHYCFSSETYRGQCARIVTVLAERYGRHPAIEAWQTDNEFGCHDTTISYSPHAARRFRLWLAARYRTIDALNDAWGNVFWSQDYRSFDEIDPPNLTVTEANPSHRLDYNRFASDEVIDFNRAQVEILRRLAPGHAILHNFMGFYTEFDHFALGRDLDLATWDNYPLGFLEQFWFSDDDKRRYARQGHPDAAAFHHDLYRGVGRGRFWVMEQQPGPVNWARFNPAPLPGMVRAWTFEALGHGAEVVSYFRWRQAPFGQEQMHAGLTRPDRVVAPGGEEAAQVARELGLLGQVPPRGPAPVALMFDYQADWITHIQPQGADYKALRLVFEFYAGLRRLGLDVDIVSPDAAFEDYALVVIPCLPCMDDGVVEALARHTGPVLLGPRAGSKTRDFHLPPNLPPGPLQKILPLKVTRVESLAPRISLGVKVEGRTLSARSWREEVETELEPLARFEDGGGAWYRQGMVDYLATWPGAAFLDHVLRTLAERAGLVCRDLPDGVRISRRGDWMIAVNYDSAPRRLGAVAGGDFLIGGPDLAPAGVAIWRQA